MKATDTIQLPGFEVLTSLSSGGMGEVWLAHRIGAQGFAKLLAIKVIRGEIAQRKDIQAMFLDEGRLVARLEHPTIAQVHAFGEHDGTLYMAMEYVSGIALHRLLATRQQPLPPLVALRIASEVAQGLHVAHELRDARGEPLNVVHRDISPGNVIVTFDGHVKILDFGIAFMADRESPETQTGDRKGKPSYMSPEQMRGESVDRRSDLYSLTIVLYELLTGRKLFDRQKPLELLASKEGARFPLPSTLVCHPMPVHVDEVVRRGLAPKRNDRFQDAREMTQRLEEVIVSNAADGFETANLATFVDRSLFVEREAHREWLRAVLSHDPAQMARDDAGEATALTEVHPLGDPTVLLTTNDPPIPPHETRTDLSWAFAVAMIALAVVGYISARLWS